MKLEGGTGTQTDMGSVSYGLHGGFTLQHHSRLCHGIYEPIVIRERHCDNDDNQFIEESFCLGMRALSGIGQT